MHLNRTLEDVQHGSVRKYLFFEVSMSVSVLVSVFVLRCICVLVCVGLVSV